MRRIDPLMGHDGARSARHKASLETIKVEPNVPKIVMRFGKRCVNVEHKKDVIVDGEIVATLHLKVGEFVFPDCYGYVNGEVRFVGETKDARHIEGAGWAIYLDDAVLRDKDGKPVLMGGMEVDLSGWYLESALRPSEGRISLRLGATAKRKKVSIPMHVRDMIPRSAWADGFRLENRHDMTGLMVSPRRDAHVQEFQVIRRRFVAAIFSFLRD